MRKELGKIKEVFCGIGGYQNAQIGIGFTLGGEGWGAGTPFYGAWATERSSMAEWTEADRIESLGKVFMRIRNWLEEAKVQNVYELKGVPVECIFEGGALKDWRILKEVL